MNIMPRSFLSNPVIFGVDLYDSPYSAGLAGKVEEFFRELISGAGSVKRVLADNLN